MRSILIVVVLLLVLIALLVVLALLVVNRVARARLRRAVEAEGYSYTAEDASLLERLQAPPFGLGGERSAYDVVRGARDGRPFTFWTQDWWAGRALAKARKDRDLADKHAIAAALVEVDGPRPLLEIITHRIGDADFVPLGQQLPDHPGLPGVSIFGDDAGYAAQVLSDDLVALIAGQSSDARVNLRVAEGAAIAWSDPAKQGSPDWRTLLESVQALAARA